MTVNRTTFLIDGFNIYHSIIKASKVLGKSTKWLNYKSLCDSYLPQISKDAKTTKIYYFTAYANHLSGHDPDKVKRHKNYISCLEDLGLVTVLGRFKEKYVYCHNCKKEIRKHEEKETDVAISIKLFEIFHKDECDTAVILTGDTDIIPAIKTVKSIFGNKNIISLFPYHRKNEELKSVSDMHFSIKRETYLKHLLPNPYKLKGGTEIIKPASW